MAEEINWDDVSALMGELREMAEGLLRLEGSAQSLQPTALVLSALRRQVPAGKHWGEISWTNRSYFLGAMYQAMRRALIDHARARRARKRQCIKPIQLEDLHFEDLGETGREHPERIEAILTALERLRLEHPEWAEIVEHRFFAGYTIEETARVMEKGEKTIRRWWDRARVFLYSEALRLLNDKEEGDGS